MMRRFTVFFMVLAVSLGQLALAADATPPEGVDDAGFSSWITAQRDDVKQQRAVVGRDYDAQELVCWRRFAVNDCLHAARVQRRQQLEVLRQRDLRLNDLERQRRADQRLRAIADKAGG